MPIRVKAPDGSIAEFPDGTDPAVIQRAMASQFGAPAATTSPDTSAGEPVSPFLPVNTREAPQRSDLDALRQKGLGGQLAGELALMTDATAEGLLGLGDMVLDVAKFAADGGIDAASTAFNLVRPWPLDPEKQRTFVEDNLRPSTFFQDNVQSLHDSKEQLVDPLLAKVGAPNIDVAELSPRDRFVYRTSEAAIPTAITLGAATAPKAGSTAINAADDIFGAAAKQVRSAPVRASAEEIAASAGGAAGLTLAEEADLGPRAQLAAALGGSLLASPIASTPFSIADSVSGAAKDAKAARFLQENTLDPKLAASNIADDLDAARRLDAPAPSAFLSSNDEKLIALERQLRSKPDYGPGATAAERRFRSDLGDRVGDLRPQGADTRAPQKLAASQRAAMLDDIAGAQSKAQNADAAAKASRETAAVPLSAAKDGAADASRALDDVVVEGTLKPRRAERNAKYAEIDPGRGVEVNTSSIRKALDDVRAESGDQFQSRLTPTKELDELDALINGDNPVTYADLQDARSALASSIRDANVGVDGSKAPPFVDKLRRIKQAIDDLDPSAVSDPAAAKAAAEAADFHKSEFAPFFGRGAGKELRKAVDRDDFSRSNTSPADTAARFFIKTGRNSEDAAKDLREILRVAPDEAAGMDAVRNYMFASAARTLDADGAVNPTRLRAFLDKHQGPLRAFPEVESELRSVLKSAVNADDAAKAAKADLARLAKEAKITEAEFNKSAAAIFLDNDPETAVRKIMSSSDKQKAMADALRLVSKDPQAKSGFKAAAADWLRESVSGTASGKTADSTDPITVGALTKLLRKNRNTLSGVFDEKEIKALEDVNQLLRTSTRIDSVRGSNQSVTAELALSDVDTTLLEAALRAKYGILKAGGIMRMVGKVIGRGQELAGVDRNARAVKLREMLLDISTDPEKAIHLLNYERTKAWDKKFSRLFLAGEALDEDETPAE